MSIISRLDAPEGVRTINPLRMQLGFETFAFSRFFMPFHDKREVDKTLKNNIGIV